MTQPVPMLLNVVTTHHAVPCSTPEMVGVFVEAAEAWRFTLEECGLGLRLNEDFPQAEGYHLEWIGHFEDDHWSFIQVVWIYDSNKAFEMRMRGGGMLDPSLNPTDILARHLR